MLKMVCAAAVIAMAMSFQIYNGSFDFSIGAIICLSAIVGGVIAVSNRYNVYVMALLIISVAVTLALINGILYITLKIPQRLISLIALMIYEAMTQIFNGGRGIIITTRPRYAILYHEPHIFIITFIMMALYWALMKYTVWGFEARALFRGQKISIDFGIEEKQNIIKRYAIVGLFLGVGAVLYLSQILRLEAVQNMESTIVMFSSIMPVMMGGVLARYANIPVGIFLGSLCTQFINVGFICMGLDSNLAGALSGIFLLAFVAYTGNLPALKQYFYRGKIRAKLENEFNAAAAR
jgi:ribose transport system permease protein